MVARPQFLSKYFFFLQTLSNRPLHIVAIRWLITKNVDSFGMPYLPRLVLISPLLPPIKFGPIIHTNNCKGPYCLQGLNVQIKVNKSKMFFFFLFLIFNRPGVAGATLQRPFWTLYYFAPSPFSSRSSPTTCHMSGVRCNISRDYFFLLLLQSGGACCWRVFYQQGLPRLVLTCSDGYLWLGTKTFIIHNTLSSSSHLIDSCL